ncbi:WYL domain-containing protein [Microbispora triticiradicis]|uniref:WYL domain-containing protein n=3 Tax=Microbispora TaxID=2005 RepID=A0ABY3LUA0_9ACTN|nr:MULTISPECIES: WYL domain-containing protein [Microbispora]RGA06644.1 WYL domain-containing protein [Microbispora triticiradicis]TLP60567.1 WYL domain-containing protein [Microbispora fusca]TYB54855.1 WYL domain-containing protein [Microbispora tritici]GLW20953.1 transcriptional regulator [Microbispora amethystogenes]
MRASRLLSLLLLLQTRDRVTAAELAEELEVSVRTVYRDVEALSAAGVPVYADRGPLGGYRLLDGYRTRLNGLTAEEASSLFLAGLPGPAAELGLGEFAAAAELKLLAALPPGPRSHAARMRERFHLDVPGWYRSADEAPFLTEVAEAVWEERVLRTRYRRWGPAEVERLLHPYGLVLKGGSWYLAAACSGTVRTYRVSRIIEAEVLGERFERPPDFDLAEFWRDFAEEFAARMYTAEAVVRLAPGGEDLFRYTLGGDVVDKALANGHAEPGGWTRLTVPIESLTHARWLLLRLGTLVEVLEPAELRALMAEAVADLSRLYGTRQEPGTAG